MADIVAKRFWASEEATLIQDQPVIRKVDSKISSLRFDCCAQAATRRLLQQYRPPAEAKETNRQCPVSLVLRATLIHDDSMRHAHPFVVAWRLWLTPASGPWAREAQLKFGPDAISIERSHTYLQRHAALDYWRLIPIRR
jgi:hypothetical protein